MRYFLISCSFLLMACGSYPKKNAFKKAETATLSAINPYFSDMDRDYIYKAKITFANRSFGGLFVVKKLGPDQHRVVFTTEMGNKLLDFSFEGSHFKVNYILEEMNKKILINLLRKDFYVLIHERPTVIDQYIKKGGHVLMETKLDKHTYFYLQQDNDLKKVLEIRRGKEKTVYEFSGIEDRLAREID
ncbi:MAG TPA: hypothetical protein VLZ54_00570, partial [Arenibacter sp.]|nr:hypothetical protein [Arenibacter sp.]